MSMWTDPEQMELASKMMERQANSLDKDSPERAKLLKSVASLKRHAERVRSHEELRLWAEQPSSPNE
jgi:hypothetical protein